MRGNLDVSVKQKWIYSYDPSLSYDKKKGGQDDKILRLLLSQRTREE